MCQVAQQDHLHDGSTVHRDRGVGGVDGPIAALLATNYSILDTFKQNMQTWRVSLPCCSQHVHEQHRQSCQHDDM